MRLADVDTKALLELVWVAPLAAVTVAITFSFVIHGVARASDSRRAGKSVAATAYVAMAVIAATAFASSVIFGILVITSKD